MTARRWAAGAAVLLVGLVLVGLWLVNSPSDATRVGADRARQTEVVGAPPGSTSARPPAPPVRGIPSRYAYTTDEELAARRAAKALDGPVTQLRERLNGYRRPTDAETQILVAWEKDPNRRNLRIVQRAVTEVRTAMMYVGSPHTAAMYEQELDLWALGQGDAPTAEQVGAIACALVDAPRDCDPQAWPWCFGADLLEDVATQLCADPSTPLPDDFVRQEGDWVRDINGAPRRSYRPRP